MIAQIYHRSNAPTFTPPEGDWLSIVGTNQSTTLRQEIFWKVADADDVAASNFVWTSTGTGTFIGVITPITGFNSGTPIGTSSGEGNGASTTPDNSLGATPADANSLLLFLIGTDQETSTPSNYAIATDDPGGWSEHYEVQSTTGADGTAAMAYVTRPATSATGACSCSLAVSLASVIQVVFIKPAVAGGSIVPMALFHRRQQLMS